MSDPLEYPDLARRSHFFFDTGRREPLYVQWAGIFLDFFETESLALRAASLVATALGFAALITWLRFSWNFTAALAASIAAFLNKPLAYYALQGHNMTGYCALLVVFAALWFSKIQRRWIFLGIMGGLLALTRLEGLAVAGLCFAWDFFTKKRKTALKSLALCLLILSPYLIYQKITLGSFFASHRGHASYWMNREAGAEGAVESQKQSFSGFFSANGALSSGTRWIKGFALGFFWYLPRLWQGAVWLLPLMLFALWRLKDWRWIYLIAAILFPVAYILPLDQIAPGSGVEIRFVLPLAWPTAALIGIGFAQAIKKAPQAWEAFFDKLKNS